MFRIIIFYLVSVLVLNPLQAMERPVEEKRGIKRPIEQCGEEEIELPETASEKIEKVEPIGSVRLNYYICRLKSYVKLLKP